MTPWGSLRAEITFRVVPSWVGRPGLSPGLGQSPVWASCGRGWDLEGSSCLQLRQCSGGRQLQAISWAISSSFLRGMLGSPSQHSSPWDSLFSKVHGESCFLQEAPPPLGLWPLTGPAAPLSPLAPQHCGSFCSKAQLPMLKRPDGQQVFERAEHGLWAQIQTGSLICSGSLDKLVKLF